MEDYLEYLTRMRRRFHGRPEIAYHEFATQAAIAAELDGMGIPYQKVGTGLIARIHLGKAKAIAFRADMDALPIAEGNDVPYKSQIPGMMHACGHDGHMALLLAFAKYCSQNTDKIAADAVFIFQPAEEGEGGAVKMIEAGALDGVGEVFAVHLDPSLPEGVTGLRAGAAMAGAYEMDIVAEGESSHCAEKHLGKDALATMVDVINAAYDAVRKEPEGKILFHCGRIEGGFARNVVANRCASSCTIRYFEEAHLKALLGLIEAEMALAKERHGAACYIKPIARYIPLKNHPESVEKVKKYIEHIEHPPKFIAEDFAFYLDKVKGCLIWLGVKGQKGERKLHSPDFDFDEKALLFGLNVYKKIIEEG
jgi:amidohydrolase